MFWFRHALGQNIILQSYTYKYKYKWMKGYNKPISEQFWLIFVFIKMHIYLHEKQTVLKSHTCRRSASDSGCSSLPLGWAHARLWLDRSRHWPRWPPSHWRFRKSPQWSTAGRVPQRTIISELSFDTSYKNKAITGHLKHKAKWRSMFRRICVVSNTQQLSGRLNIIKLMWLWRRETWQKETNGWKHLKILNIQKDCIHEIHLLESTGPGQMSYQYPLGNTTSKQKKKQSRETCIFESLFIAGPLLCNMSYTVIISM